MKTHKKLY